MSIIHNISLKLKITEILRQQGFKEYSKVRPEIKTLIGELLASISDDHLLAPAIAYEIYSITEVGHHRVRLEGNTALYGSLLPSVLLEAKELSAVVCTIGPRLEERMTDYFDRSEPLSGLLLDGIGSAAVNSLAQEVCKLIAHEASLRNYQASSPLSPGMSGFPISEQWRLFELVPAEEIKVSLTPYGIMVPRKSVSMVIGIGLQRTTWTQAEVCARCNLKETCLYRIQA